MYLINIPTNINGIGININQKFSLLNYRDLQS